MLLPIENREFARLAIRVKQKAVPYIRSGHPWLFADSVERCSKEGKPGDVAVLFDPDKKLIGAGLYDPLSPVRVRILAHDAKQPPVGPELFRHLVQKAKELRDGKIPHRTNAWRLIHGESDGFSGLVADRYDHVLVIKLYSAAYLSRAGEVAQAIQSVYPELDTVVIRLSRELQQMSGEIRCGLADGMAFPDFDGKVIFQENGIRFEADVKTGQKTGFFLDQRDNRSRVEALSHGKDVLNVFCFSGGFSLYAARGGAKSVTSVDYDKHAIEACHRNFGLNKELYSNVKACRHTGLRGDAFQEMAKLAAAKKTFDIVIVDPPSFAKSAADVPAALRSYSNLAKAALKLLRKNGTLVFASCSSRATPDDVFRCAENAGEGKLEVFDKTFHAPDHPALFAESGYLKCLWAKWK